MNISIEELMELLDYMEDSAYRKNKIIEESISEIHNHIYTSEERILNKLASDNAIDLEIDLMPIGGFLI